MPAHDLMCAWGSLNLFKCSRLGADGYDLQAPVVTLSLFIYFRNLLFYFPGKCMHPLGIRHECLHADVERIQNILTIQKLSGNRNFWHINKHSGKHGAKFFSSFIKGVFLVIGNMIK